MCRGEENQVSVNITIPDLLSPLLGGKGLDREGAFGGGWGGGERKECLVIGRSLKVSGRREGGEEKGGVVGVQRDEWMGWGLIPDEGGSLVFGRQGRIYRRDSFRRMEFFLSLLQSAQTTGLPPFHQYDVSTRPATSSSSSPPSFPLSLCSFPPPLSSEESSMLSINHPSAIIPQYPKSPPLSPSSPAPPRPPQTPATRNMVTYLGKPNILRFLTEALTADIEAVFPDQPRFVRAYSTNNTITISILENKGMGYIDGDMGGGRWGVSTKRARPCRRCGGGSTRLIRGTFSCVDFVLVFVRFEVVRSC